MNREGRWWELLAQQQAPKLIPSPDVQEGTYYNPGSTGKRPASIQAQTLACKFGQLLQVRPNGMYNRLVVSASGQLGGGSPQVAYLSIQFRDLNVKSGLAVAPDDGLGSVTDGGGNTYYVQRPDLCITNDTGFGSGMFIQLAEQVPLWDFPYTVQAFQAGAGAPATPTLVLTATMLFVEGGGQSPRLPQFGTP